MLSGLFLRRDDAYEFNTTNQRIPLYENGHYSIVHWSNIHQKNSLLKKLNIPNRSEQQLTESKIILEAYRKWGVDCPKHIYGDYCFAIFNNNKHQLYIARDHMGTRPLYYYLDDNIFAFSSSLEFFHKNALITMIPCEEWIVNYLIDSSMDFEKTAYKNIYKLKPAYCMLVGNRTSSKQQYFEFDAYSTRSFNNIENALDEYQEKLFTAVNTRINSSSNLGCELSGGIDSSSVTAIAAHQYKNPLENFYTFSRASHQYEPEYILCLSQQLSLPNNIIRCGPMSYGTSKALDHRAMLTLGYPIDHVSSRGAMPEYKNAQQLNVDTYLSGFGGDEFVTSIHTNIAQQQLFREKKIADLINSFSGSKILKYLKLIKFPYHTWQHNKTFKPNLHTLYKKRWQLNILNEEIIQQKQLDAKYLNLTTFDRGYQHLNEFTLQKRWAPFVTTRLETCSLIAQSYDLNISWPLLDVPLIELFLSTPIQFKFRNGIPRYFHRKAMQDLLPKKIAWKQHKGMGPRTKPLTHKKAYFTLQKKLHPMLEPIVNIEKFNNQIESRFNQNNTNNLLQHQSTQNSIKLNNLNNWLNHYHSVSNTSTLDEETEKALETIE